jgi:hypothetical protein
LPGSQAFTIGRVPHGDTARPNGHDDVAAVEDGTRDRVDSPSIGFTQVH